MTEPLLFLHGFAGGPETFEGITRGLERHGLERPCLLPYLSGHGDLPASEWTQSFEAELTRLAELVQGKLHDPAHVVGYSLGARVSLGLLVRHPELVSRATLIGVHPGLRGAQERSERRQSDRGFLQVLEQDGVERFVEIWEAQAIFAGQARLPHDLLERQRRVRLGHTAAGLAHAIQTLGLAEMPDFWPFLPDIDRSVTLVVGAEDRKFYKLAREMCSLLPQASVVVAPACGHNVALEAPDLIRRTLGTRSEFS